MSLNDEDEANNRYVCSINFDRSGEAMAVGTSDKIMQIYDVERA